MLLWLFEGGGSGVCLDYPPNMDPFTICGTPIQLAASSTYPPNMLGVDGAPSAPSGYPPNMDPYTDAGTPGPEAESSTYPPNMKPKT